MKGGGTTTNSINTYIGDIYTYRHTHTHIVVYVMGLSPGSTHTQSDIAFPTRASLTLGTMEGQH